jgi:hypothetical protein
LEQETGRYGAGNLIERPRAASENPDPTKGDANMKNNQQQNHRQLTLERIAAQQTLGRLAAGPTDDPIVAGWQREHLLQKVRRIEAALQRLEEGATYGICQQCGGAIAAERLALMPYAELCVPCQQQLGRRTLGVRRLSPIAQPAR